MTKNSYLAIVSGFLALSTLSSPLTLAQTDLNTATSANNSVIVASTDNLVGSSLMTSDNKVLPSSQAFSGFTGNSLAGNSAGNTNNTNTTTTSTSFSTTTSSGFETSSMESSMSAAGTNVQTNKITGEVLKIDGNRLTVKTDTETREFLVPNNIKITRDTNDVKLEEIKPEDRVTLTQDSFGQLLAVEIISEETQDLLKYLIPLTILLLVALGLIWYFVQKNNKGKIKTAAPTQPGSSN